MSVVVSKPKPLLRGWLHAAAAVLSVAVTALFVWRTWDDPPKAVSMLIFGLSMIALYTVSAVYHIGDWRPRVHRVLRSIDHSNIFLVIAGTYTPLCYNVLGGWVRAAILGAVWAVGIAGIGLAVLRPRLSRKVATGLYIGMGWISVAAVPALLEAIPVLPIFLMAVGGALYTIGGIIYATKRPDPFPRVFGFHEIFHLFVIAGSVVMAVVIWIWVVPYPRA